LELKLTIFFPKKRVVDGTGIVLGGDAKTMAKLHLQAALCEPFESSEEVSLALCLPLPKDLSQALLHAAQAVAGKATSWSPVLAEILKPRFLNKKAEGGTVDGNQKFPNANHHLGCRKPL